MASESEERTELAEERTEIAGERTEWADQRTYLAQERTFAGWIRTSLTSMAVGFGIIEFVQEVEPEWLISVVGFLFIVVGGFINILAFMSYRKISMDMTSSEQPEMATSTRWIVFITVGLSICAVGGLIIVFL